MQMSTLKVKLPLNKSHWWTFQCPTALALKKTSLSETFEITRKINILNLIYHESENSVSHLWFIELPKYAWQIIDKKSMFLLTLSSFYFGQILSAMHRHNDLFTLAKICQVKVSTFCTCKLLVMRENLFWTVWIGLNFYCTKSWLWGKMGHMDMTFQSEWVYFSYFENQ